jgi:hypothetical protein
LAADSNADAALRANALIGLGHMMWFQGNYASMCSPLEESLALGRKIGDLKISGASALKRSFAIEAPPSAWSSLSRSDPSPECGRTYVHSGTPRCFAAFRRGPSLHANASVPPSCLNGGTNLAIRETLASGAAAMRC